MAKKQGEGQKEILEECAVYAPTEGFEGKSKVTCGNWTNIQTMWYHISDQIWKSSKQSHSPG
jgi:hypothetical protein